MSNFTKNFIALIALITLTVQTQAQTVFWSEDFSGSGLPAGWVSTDVNGTGGAWAWCNDPTAANGPGCVNDWALYSNQHGGGFFSSTASNGFAVLDYDAVGPTSNLVRLTTTPIDCSAQTDVWVKFEGLIGVFDVPTANNAVLRVSTDNSNWTTYNVYNVVLGAPGTPGQRWSENPEISLIDISDVAAGSATVYLQWSWSGQWEYYWLLDDIELYDADPTEIFVPANDIRVNSNFFAGAPNAVWPISQVEAFGFLADVENVGFQPQTNVNLNITITNEITGNTVYTEDLSYGTIPAFTLVENELFPGAGYLPTAQGVYKGTYTITSDSTDTNPDNNTQEFDFVVGDSLFAKEFGATRTVYPAAGNWTVGEARSWAYGNYFRVNNANGQFFRYVSFGLVGDATNTGEIVIVKLYKWTDGNNDGIVDPGERVTKGAVLYQIQGNETAAGIITLPILDLFTDTPIALEDNSDYIVVIEYQTDSQIRIDFAASEDVDYSAMVFRSQELGAPRYSAVLGIAGNLDAEPYSSVGFGRDIVPVVRVSIGNPTVIINTEEVLSNESITLFPNPTSSEVNLQLHFDQTMSNVTINLIDLNGRMLQSRQLKQVQNQQERFDVSQLPAGAYFFHIVTDQGVRTQRFIKN
jgi:hypothetical protein